MALRSSRCLHAMAPRRVAVVGGGPAGLSMVSQLLAINRHQQSAQAFAVTLFERRTAFSGVWCYDATPGPCVVRFDASGRAHALWADGKKDGDDHGTFLPPGAMYDGLRTNLPCDVMAYRSQPYAPTTSLFPDRATVEKYIVEFADDVIRHARSQELDVRLGTAVSAVKRTSHSPPEEQDTIGSGSTWSVTSTPLSSQKSLEEEFDHVVLANGRCNTPTIPPIPGLHHFRGQLLHSAWWRSPLPFEHKTVLVVGNSSSGSDIARELSGYILRTLPEGAPATKAFIDRCNTQHTNAKARVLHSYEQFDKPPPLDYDPRDPASPEWAKRIAVVPKISAVEPAAPGSGGSGRITFEDGTQRDDVDIVIFATGYAYDFPFLDQQLAPFADAPLIPTASATTRKNSSGSSEGHDGAGGCAYVPPHPTAGWLSHLDDWSLFYAPDASLCVLGAPVRIVPMPFTQVQSRVVAAAWSGMLKRADNSTALPRLDPRIPSTDPAKWTSTAPAPPRSDEAGEAREAPANRTSDLGYPSDTAYQDALLNLLPEHLKRHGEDEAAKVPAPPQIQAGTESGAMAGTDTVIDATLQPVVAKDEGWARMADYRNERRQDTKRLRRLLLGY